MKFIASMALVATLGAAAPGQAQQVLTGDTRFACEAMLCLASGQRPDECTPSLQRYWSECVVGAIAVPEFDFKQDILRADRRIDARIPDNSAGMLYQHY